MSRNADPVPFSNGNPFLADLEKSPLAEEPVVLHTGNPDGRETPVQSEILIDFGGGAETVPEAGTGPQAQTVLQAEAAETEVGLLDDFDPLQRPSGGGTNMAAAAEPEMVAETDLLGMMDPHGRPGLVEVYAAPPPGTPEEDRAEPEPVMTSPEITSPPSELISQAEVTSPPPELMSPPEVSSDEAKEPSKDGGHDTNVGGDAAKAGGSESKMVAKATGNGVGAGGTKGEHVEARTDRKAKVSPRPGSTAQAGAGGGAVAAAGAGGRGGEKPKDGATKTAEASNAKSKTSATTTKAPKSATPSAESPRKTRSGITKRGRKHRFRNRNIIN